MTPATCRGARAMLGWVVDKLAAESGVSRATITRYELGRGDMLYLNVKKLEQAMSRAGIEFLPDDGIRLKED